MKMKGKGWATRGSSEREGKAVGHGEFANMPQEGAMQTYPKSKLSGDFIDDTINRIDGENDRSQSRRSKNVSNQH